MDEPVRVVVLGEGEEVLDRALVDALREGLSELAVVERKAPGPSEAEGEPVAARLRALVTEPEKSGASWLAATLSSAEPPVVLVASRPALLRLAAEVARRGGPRPVRVGVVREPVVGREWLEAPADLLAVADEHAARSAREVSDRVRVAGVPTLPALRPLSDPPAERKRAGLAEGAHVLFVPASAVPAQERSQLLVQLSLVRADLEVLFEVEEPSEAEQLRRLAPAHGLGALLVPRGEGGARSTGLAHLVLGRPGPAHLALARSIGAPLLALPPRGRAEGLFADGLVESGAGRAVESLATLAVDLDLTLEPERYERLRERQRELAVTEPASRTAAVVREAIERRSELVSNGAGLPSGLERISEGKKRSGPPPDRFDEAAAAAREVRDRADLWSDRARLARERGEADLALEAEKRASRHQETLGRLLDRIRPEGWVEPPESPNLEDELAALRRRALQDDNVERRLRSLEVDDELRELKARLSEE